MKGAYLLLINVREKYVIETNAKSFVIPEGKYVYVGSSMVNLRKRIERHLRKNKRKFWHIDFLLSVDGVEIERIYVKENIIKEEREIAKKFAENFRSVRKFGSSDDKDNESHLFFVNNFGKFEELIRHLKFKPLSLHQFS